jgi:FemAB-related protein (PEP-CTERM system-associated)
MKIYHQPAFLSIIEKVFGHSTYTLTVLNNIDEIMGYLQLVHFKSRIFGNYLVSMPFLNYGGLCSINDVEYSDILGELIDIRNKLRVDYIELREDKAIDLDLPVKKEKVSMVLDLLQDEDELWSSFPSKLRSQIRKPIKEGFTAKVGRLEELESFYRVFSITMRDLGTPVYPKSFFREILEKFPRESFICSVYLGKVAVASGFLLHYKKTVEIPWAASLSVYKKNAPNMLLYWSCLVHAVRNDAHIFDFGRSSPESGTYKFKKQWGATPKQLYWYYLLKEGDKIPDLSPQNPKFRFAIEAWKRIPVPLTRLLGPRIVKFIP